MRDVITMWKHTKMVVLVALTAAVYAAVLTPFKVAVIIPGFTEVRPGAAVPVVFGLLFGPAAAWGSAFGNLVGDFSGTLGPGSIPGMVGNFLLAYVPYRMWRAFRGDRPADGSASQLGWLILCAATGGVACAVTIGFGVSALGLVPYGAFATAVSINNGIIGTAISVILLPLLYPRAWKWGLIYTDVLDVWEYRGRRVARTGAVLTILGCLMGLLLALAFFVVGLLGPSTPALAQIDVKTMPVPAAGLCSLLIIIGVVMMSPFGRAADGSDAAKIAAEEES